MLNQIHTGCESLLTRIIIYLFFLVSSDDIMLRCCFASSAVQRFSCAEMTSTSAWQLSPTKWTIGCQNTLLI